MDESTFSCSLPSGWAIVAEVTNGDLVLSREQPVRATAEPARH
jgi:hypothetical protein